MTLEQGHTYSAKRPASVGVFDPVWNDRMILRLWENSVQYDSPTIRDGRKYPIVSKEKFLRWAKEDVTDEIPEGSWRSAQ